MADPQPPPQRGDGDDQRTSFNERHARIREAATRIHEQAQHDVARLRVQGWTKQDFARALRNLLGADANNVT
jgi:GrpB-like predicted nucleotidyltransferase (UPF0157 family)